MTISTDKIGYNAGCLLRLPFTEGTGLVTHDTSKAPHKMTLTGPPDWLALPSGQPYLSFDGAADYLQCPAADSIDLNFTFEDWTLLTWVYNAAGGGAQLLLDQGRVDVDGWQWFLFGTNISLRTNQAGSHDEIAAVGGLVPSVWQLTGVTRAGIVGQFFRNGVPIATTLGAGLANPVSVAGGRKLLVGVQEDEASNRFTGGLTIPRAWPRRLSNGEMAQIFEVERSRFGV
ncbi:MAG: LamG-like jellyroll fold domain-containing protein [Chloroflexota bacterium]